MCATWNVKGLTDLKSIELILYMKKYGIDILCIQETWLNNSCVYQEQGHMIILSGDGADCRSWAGVGFILSPSCKQHVKSYKQVSDRLCTLKLRVKEGVSCIVAVYAPHNLRPIGERFQFFAEMLS